MLIVYGIKSYLRTIAAPVRVQFFFNILFVVFLHLSLVCRIETKKQECYTFYTNKGGMSMKQGTWRRIKRYKMMYLFLLPALITVILFSYKPMVGIIMAFQDFNINYSYLSSPFVGLKHFREFLQDPDFYRALRNTLALGSLSLLFGFPIPIIFALILNEKRYLRDITAAFSEVCPRPAGPVVTSITGAGEDIGVKHVIADVVHGALAQFLSVLLPPASAGDLLLHLSEHIFGDNRFVGILHTIPFLLRPAIVFQCLICYNWIVQMLYSDSRRSP